MIQPTLEHEQQLWNEGCKFVAGVDEVGRGALAGPVVAAAVIFTPEHQPIKGVRDSKTLSKLQKNTLYNQICACCVGYALGEASPAEIDTLGIVEATAVAMSRALEKLPTVDHVLIDGLPFKKANLLSTYNKTFIVKGDSHSYSIAAASILAKVYRDRIMTEVASTIQQYSFEKNVGYGSRTHLQAIEKYGISGVHRKSFLSRFIRPN